MLGTLDFSRVDAVILQGAGEPLANVGSTDGRCREWLSGKDQLLPRGRQERQGFPMAVGPD